MPRHEPAAALAQPASMQPVYQPLPPPGWTPGGPVQQVQYLGEVPERPLDNRIETIRQGGEDKVDVIHHRSQLMVTRQPIRRIFISDPAIMEVVQYSPLEISLLGLGLGTTDLQIWFEGSNEPLMYVVTVIRDPALEEQRRLDYGKIERKLALLYPNSKVYLIPMSRKIIVRGQARDAEEAARIMQVIRGEILTQDGSIYGGDLYGNTAAVDPIANGGVNGLNNGLLSSFIVNEMQVPGEFQVKVRIRIAEVNRAQLRRMGIDWSMLFNDARHLVTQTAFAGAPGLTGIFNNGEINVALDMLASNATAKIMEDATVTTLSGEPAAFLAGGEFAVPTTVGLQGVAVGTTTFRGFGTSVITTPTVVDRDLIRLQIVPELSEISGANNVGGIPGLNVRRVQTRVELREGQTIVLGGLFSRQQRAEVTRIPFLGELPIIGSYLFSGKRATEDELELLIVVTPEIVRPMDAEEVPPLPGWYVTHPDDFDFYKYNRTEGNPDLGHHQLLPYGNGQGIGHDRGYNFYAPAPADAQIAPAATGGYGGGAYPDPQQAYPQHAYPDSQQAYPHPQQAYPDPQQAYPQPPPGYHPGFGPPPPGYHPGFGPPAPGSHPGFGQPPQGYHPASGPSAPGTGYQQPYPNSAAAPQSAGHQAPMLMRENVIQSSGGTAYGAPPADRRAFVR